MAETIDMDQERQHQLARHLTRGLYRMRLLPSIDVDIENAVRDALAEALRGRAWGSHAHVEGWPGGDWPDLS